MSQENLTTSKEVANPSTNRKGYKLVRFFRDLVGKNQADETNEKVFRFGYMQHPFDDENIFEVSASNQEEANKKALEKLVQMSREGIFVGLEPKCWPK